jgi:hypothetical protein
MKLAIGGWHVKTQWVAYNVFLGVLIWGSILAIGIIFTWILTPTKRSRVDLI